MAWEPQSGRLTLLWLSTGSAVAEIASNDLDIFMMDYFVPPEFSETPAVLVAQASPAAPTLLRPFAFCKDVGSNNPDSAWNVFSIFGYGELQDLAKITNHTVRLLQAPAHGTVSLGDDARTPLGKEAMNFKTELLAYHPTLDYVGKDRAVFEVEANGKRYRVTVNFWVMPYVPEDDEGNTFCKLQKFSVSDGDTPNLTAWLASADLSAFVAAASGVTYTFSTLSNAAVGSTVGVADTAQINLDLTAAGHGWYIDPTPLDKTDDHLRRPPGFDNRSAGFG